MGELVLFGETVQVNDLETLRGPDHMDMIRNWLDAYDLWLASRGSDNTRRVYNTAWQQFLAYVSPVMPWNVSRTHVARWVDELRAQGMKPETINLRVAALSSFFQYARDEYEIIFPDGSTLPLGESNPAASKSLRTKVNPYGKAIYLDAEQARGFLAVIPKNTIRGLRDYALMMAYLFTGRRNSEMRTIRWGAFQELGGKIYYTWSGKGKRNQRYEIPRVVYDAIVKYLRAAGRLDEIQETDFVFTALGESAARLKNVSGEFDPYAQALSMREVGRVVKKYARKSGLDPKKITVHTLRHTAAMLRRKAGDDLENISQFLAHSSLAITQIYLHSVEGNEYEWDGVEALLGVKPQQ